ncbi:MAG: betaine--homocysteine S-methyltransferase [Rhodobacteraceae bacterium]|nr:betaine--homocysteine S-methyltransferase [Paracoccaceae bacterium]
MDALTKLLSERDWLLADGATGTSLFAMGLEAGEAPELWNVDQPAKIRALYDGAINAGSDIFLTNSFGGTAARLKLHNAQDRVRELNRVAAEIGREAADASGRTIIVAGSVGPTGDIMEPVGDLSHARAVEMFEEQAVGLMEGGADVLWVETISAPEEFRAAAEAFNNINAPWCGTMSFDTAGRTMMGLTSTAMVDMVAEIPNQPIAFGANCGVGAADILRTVLGICKKNPSLPVIAKGNAGIPKYVDGHIHYDGTPDLMAKYAVMARNCGAKIIGGCCGTKPEHLIKMREALENMPLGSAPTLAEIEAVLGGFSSEDDGTTGKAPPVRIRRRRK